MTDITTVEVIENKKRSGWFYTFWIVGLINLLPLIIGGAGLAQYIIVISTWLFVFGFVYVVWKTLKWIFLTIFKR